ncbi:hypothetical protein [Microbacterium sp. P04]|uniref:hypothetical protein n=1 Tax=Microbacterium sp. P04 TaxID=3366947 RepID=UPI003744E8E7
MSDQPRIVSIDITHLVRAALERSGASPQHPIVPAGSSDAPQASASGGDVR